MIQKSSVRKGASILMVMLGLATIFVGVAQAETYENVSTQYFEQCQAAALAGEALPVTPESSFYRVTLDAEQDGAICEVQNIATVAFQDEDGPGELPDLPSPDDEEETPSTTVPEEDADEDDEPAEVVETICHPAYPSFCLDILSTDSLDDLSDNLSCLGLRELAESGEIDFTFREFDVDLDSTDTYGFDVDQNGIGCEVVTATEDLSDLVEYEDGSVMQFALAQTGVETNIMVTVGMLLILSGASLTLAAKRQE